MNLNERIEGIKPYFILFNVSAEEDAIYAVVRFPQNWAIPDKDGLRSTFKVELAPMQNGICFATETKNGPDCVFDALDYVIKFNKCVEERRELLKEKVNELKELFAKEDLEKLKSLTFTFEKPKKRSTKKVEPVQDTEEQKQEVEEVVPDEKNNPAEENDTSLMSFAKNMVDD